MNNLLIATQNLQNIPPVSLLQQAQIAYQEFNNIFIELSTTLNEIYELSNKALKSYQIAETIKKLSETHYVFWDFIPQELANKICYATDTNTALKEYEIQNNGQATKKIFELCLKHQFISDQKTLLSQTFNAYLNEQYNLAIVGLFSIIDKALKDATTEISSRKIILKTRCETLLKKLLEEKISNREYSIITFLKTFKSAKETFIADSDFSQEEPEYPNRHWVMHGRATKIYTDLDYIKLLRFLYGILIISDLPKKTDE